MSPEYALRGRFSVKSDVYSFGVILLEIVTGRKNRVYYQEESPESNLVEHVWNLWLESNALEVVDSSLGESYPKNEVLRCIHIALLCVQEYAIDRPTMSAVLIMLGNDATLPSPKQPAFLLQRSATIASRDSSTKDGIDSVNNVSCTMIEGR
ncbi:cysteine-rich receptor-like protein kinase 25 [Argentina anserina]|uniref:cysteine-rich receptor-like protein kinase 25 n=1 Tax=Argentina anserina TaxID=57926 RepID=UPI002176643C|nr:cysteine-rich receptor-like protein kinase 25 [Potentilla anserina]